MFFLRAYGLKHIIYIPPSHVESSRTALGLRLGTQDAAQALGFLPGDVGTGDGKKVTSFHRAEECPKFPLKNGDEWFNMWLFLSGYGWFMGSFKGKSKGNHGIWPSSKLNPQCAPKMMFEPNNERVRNCFGNYVFSVLDSFLGSVFSARFPCYLQHFGAGSCHANCLCKILELEPVTFHRICSNFLVEFVKFWSWKLLCQRYLQHFWVRTVYLRW